MSNDNSIAWLGQLFYKMDFIDLWLGDMNFGNAFSPICQSAAHIKASLVKSKTLFRDNSSSPHDLDLREWNLQMAYLLIMVRTKISPSNVTLTSGLPERMFQMAHLQVKENNSVKFERTDARTYSELSS